MIDITIVTARKHLEEIEGDVYSNNIFLEYQLLKSAIEKKGLSIQRVAWDDATYNWSQTKVAVIRTVWDYFERFDAFNIWMVETAAKTKLINSLALQQWNSHKGYLNDLQQRGVRIVPTEFIKAKSDISLAIVSAKRGWKKMVIKPAISAAAFHTYKISEANLTKLEPIFKELLQERDMLVQEFQETIVTKGEASLMVFNGVYTHAILKKAKTGDFRVQDDFGGTVHPYIPTQDEIAFALHANAQCPTPPVYGRVDIIWDKKGRCYLSEMEFLDPEIWVRNAPDTAMILAEAIAKQIR